MCGIVGVAGTIGRDHEKMFKGLLEIDTARGPHSTGLLNVARYDKKTPYTIDKCLGTPWDLYRSLGQRHLIPGLPRLLIGHNRFATRGAITKENAHPFQFGDVIGVHNGTLIDYVDLEGRNQFAIDSQVLYNHLSKHGVENTVSNMRGAFALVWYDVGDETLNLVRNSQRPLYFAFTEDNKTIFWASEKWMLESQFERFNIKHNKITKLDELIYCKLSIPDSGKVFEKVRAKRVKEKEPPTPKSYGSYPYGGTGGANRHPFGQGYDRGQNQGTSVTDFETNRKLRSHVQLVRSIRLDCKVRNDKDDYIRGHLVSDPKVSVRIYGGDKIWNDPERGPDTIYQAYMKKANYKSRYMLCDRRSVKKLEDSKKEVGKLLEDKSKDTYEDDDDFFDRHLEDRDVPWDYLPIRNNIYVPEETFIKETNKGCGWCASPARPEEAHDLYWTSDGDFFCTDCQKLTEVKEYLTQ